MNENDWLGIEEVVKPASIDHIPTWIKGKIYVKYTADNSRVKDLAKDFGYSIPLIYDIINSIKPPDHIHNPVVIVRESAV